MRTLISLTLFLSFTSSLFLKLTNWFFPDFGETSAKTTIAVKEQSTSNTSFVFVDPQVSIRDTFLVEGDIPASADTLYYVVERTDDATAFMVDYATCDSTATEGTDYAMTTGTITFAMGNSILTDTIKVPVFADDTVEVNERLFIKLSNIVTTSAGNTIMGMDSIGNGTIFDNDAAIVSIEGNSISEANAGIDSLKFVVRTDKVVDSLGLVFTTMDSTAIGTGTGTGVGGGNDYISRIDTIFVSGLVDTIKIAVVENDTVELDEFMKVMITEIYPAGRNISLPNSTAVGTITNDDIATISIRNVNILEGDVNNDSLCFVIDLSNPVDTAFGYDFTTSDSTATVGDLDYVLESGSLNFSAQTDTICIVVMADTKVELTEFLKLTLSNIQAGGRSVTFGNTAPIGIGTIINDDAATVAIQDACIEEGNIGIDTLKFIVTTSVVVDSLGIVYNTMDSTATTADNDYVNTADTIYITGVLDTIKIPVIGNDTVELEENMKVMLTEILPNSRAVTFTNTLGIGTIKNDDTAKVSIADAFLVEGNTGRDTLKFAVSTSKIVDSLGLVFMTFDSTASSVADTDFVAILTDTLYLNNLGEDTIRVVVKADTTVELDEYLKVALTQILPGNRAVCFGDSLGIGEIRNDDDAKISIIDATLVEGDAGTDSLKFAINSTKIVDSLGIIYTTLDSSATIADNDYTAVADTFYLTGFSDTIKVAVNGDTKVELNQFIKLNLTEILPGNRSVCFQDSLAIGTIENNDTAYISIRDTLVLEGDTGKNSLVFIIDLTNEVDTVLGYSYATMDSTANAPSDYTTTADNLTFSGNTDTIIVEVNGDILVELDNYLKVMLSNIVVGNRPVYFNKDLAVGTIINDDTGRLSIDDITLEENLTGISAFTFTVTLDSDLDSLLTVDFATCDSSATLADNDYIANTGTLNFAGNGTETHTLTVNVVGDGFAELDELFRVKLSNITAGGLNVIFADSIGDGIILNDDFDPSIIDPCECLGNESSTTAKDGQFAETVSVTSQAGETWYISAVTGLYQKPAGAFPPAKGGTPYSLTPFLTGITGQLLKETVTTTGVSNYTLQGIHVDKVGYEVTVTNGVNVLTIGNTCHYKNACRSEQTIVMPFFPNISGKATIDDCTANTKFINDGEHLYNDEIARHSSMTICPNITGQILTVAFQNFDLAVGDTLWAYDGIDSSATFIAKGSGNSISDMNGGWVTSNCDPLINASGCLTFVLRTNNNNHKGAGWEAIVNCALDGVTTLNPVNNVYGTAKCDSLRTPVNLRIPTINRSNAACVLMDDNIIVTYCDVRDTFPAGQLLRPVFPFGTYRVDYKLLADTTITTSNQVHVSMPSMTCNDTLVTAIGQGCVTMIHPDDILEDGCDTSYTSAGLSQFFTVKVQTDSGLVVGSFPNYPLLDASKEGNVTCNTFYKVTVVRTSEISISGCTQNVIDSCSGVVKLIDGIKPVFVSIVDDTIYGCHDMSLTQELLPLPKVIDNCEVDRVVASIPPNPSGACEADKKIEVTWTAYDLCGNSSTAIQNIVIRRPNTLTIPTDTMVDCGAATSPDVIGWPQIDSDGDKIGDKMITPESNFCNFKLTYTDNTIAGTCGGNLNILRIFTLFDDCGNVNDPIFADTQYILIRDTIAPIINCPSPNVLGSQTNPYIFRTDYNSCTGRPGTITPPSGTDDCSINSNLTIVGVYRVSDGILVGRELTTTRPLEIGEYRVAYALRDGCGNVSETCNIYFNIADKTLPTVICTDELVVSLANSNLTITPEDISEGTFDACGIDTMFIRRTLCGSTSEYPEEINPFVATKFSGSDNANGWASSIDIGCCDMNSTITVQLLVFDNAGNANRCWLTIQPQNQPLSVCGNLPDAEGYCDNFATTQIGLDTDTNNNNAFDDSEWQPVDTALLEVLNTQFGNPACNATTVCINSNIEQEYQLLKESCGAQSMRRRFRTRNTTGQGGYYPWYYQNVMIRYRSGWSFTFPQDTILQCGTTDVGNIPEMPLVVSNGTCDQIAWEVKDEIFETDDGSCYKILRQWSVINACQHSNVQTPFALPRDQFGGKVTANSKRAFSSTDVIGGVLLSTQGYFSYTQLIIVMDNDAPIITIADVDTCIVGVGDEAPFNEPDQTPGEAPYECDTLRLFSAIGLDCTASNELDFSYEVYTGTTRIAFGEGAVFYQVVQPNIAYRVEFTASDNCGNVGFAERTYTFRDCRAPRALCQGLSLSLNNNQMATITANNIDAKSYDNCTDSANLILKIWHPSLGTTAPTNVTEVLNLPDFITLDCADRGASIARLYVVDEAMNYSFCGADITINDNLAACPLIGGRPVISGRIETLEGDMVEDVEILISGTSDMPEMITTNEEGSYQYVVEQGENYTITPKKNVHPLNGVTTFDLVLMQKHILGLKTFDSPYNYIAADVNKSATVTAYDMVILRRLILNIITDFPSNESWRFVNQNYPMKELNPLTKGIHEYQDVEAIHTNETIDFMAVKIGDINGNASPNLLVGSEARNFEGIFNFQLKDQKIEAGKTYTIDFDATNINQLLGYQFTLAFEGMIFNEWGGGLVDKNYFGTTLAKRGFLTASWNRKDESELPRDEALFKLIFTATQDGLLSELLTITSDYTKAEAYNLAEEELDIQLVFEKVNTDQKVFDLYQNSPNPFKERTQIKFYLPNDSETTLTIFDVTGKVIKKQTKHYPKGETTIILEREELPASGMLYYQLESSAGKMTKTMLVLD